MFFYTGRDALLLNGADFEHGVRCQRPGAPQVFLDDKQLKILWLQPERYYLVTKQSALPHLEALVGVERVKVVSTSGGKILIAN